MDIFCHDCNHYKVCLWTMGYLAELMDKKELLPDIKTLEKETAMDCEHYNAALSSGKADAEKLLEEVYKENSRGYEKYALSDDLIRRVRNHFVGRKLYEGK